MCTSTPSAGFKGFMLALLCSVFFAQGAYSQQAFRQPKVYHLQPGSRTPFRVHQHGGHGHTGPDMKTLINDTTDVLDYSTCNELMAGLLQMNYNGSWNNPSPGLMASELTSFITPASAANGEYSFAQVVFDSLAFASYTNQSTYSIPRPGSTVTVDSLGLFMGISGDTVVADGKMANDSLLISIYRVVGNTVSLTPVQTIVNAGYAGLQPFFSGGPGYLKYTAVGVGLQFNPGESFAVRINYLNKDTSSHCLLSFSYADSCGQILYQGNTYASPAYPSPFKHSSSYGQIDSTGINTGSVTVYDNQYFFNLAGVATNCSYVFNQNWEIIALVSVHVRYGTQIQAGQTTACNGSTVNLNALVFGTDSPTIHYTWAVSAGGVLNGGTTSQANVIVPSNVTGNITVTLTVNDGSGDVVDSLVIINCHLNVNAGQSQTVCIGSNVILTPLATGGTPPYTYQWQGTGSALSCSNCANPWATLTQNSVYTVTVTDAAQTTATSSVSYTLNATTNNMQLSTTNTGISCSGLYDTTTVTVTGGTGPFIFNWGANLTTIGASPQTFNYGLPGGQQVISVTDANSCVSAVFDTVINSGPVVQITGAVEPGCPNSATGSLNVLVTGGTLPYMFNWNTGATTMGVANLSAGLYQLVVTDANGCTATASYNLSSIRDFDFYVYITSAYANCGSNGAVVTAVTGGVEPYTYNWSGGQTTGNIQPNAPGQYAVTVTDSVGCQAYGIGNMYTYCVSIISGTAFYDSTGICSMAGSSPLSNLYITATSSAGNTFYGFTDFNGNYSIEAYDTGTYTLNMFNYYGGNCGNLAFCGNSNQTVFIAAQGDSSTNNNIGFTGASGFNLGIHPGWTTANPGFTKQYWVYFYNSSMVHYNGQATLTFVYDSNLTYQYTDYSPAPVNNVATHTLTWLLDSVTGDANGWTPVDAYFMVPQTLSLSYLLQSDFTITPMTGDCDPSDNHYNYSEVVTGSHDPNEKTVSPAGPVTEADSVLTYTIHFQNTGTDSTHFVIIKDTLSPNLDPATVRNIASSDKYSSFAISGKGILTWTFNPLRIVDSITNPSGSKRFIMFTVKKKANLPIGTTISNKASIYFDYNDAVVTNTVSDTASWPLYIFEVRNNADISVKAYPNPFSDVTHIVVNGLNEKFGFELYDVTGRLQQSMPSLDNSQFDVRKGSLSKGVYLYRIIVTGKAAAFGKLVVE